MQKMATEKLSVAILRTRCLRCFDLIFLKFPKSICHLTYFSKNRTWTDDFVLIPVWHLQFNTNLLRENKDKCSLFFYAVLRGDFLFTVKKIIIKTVNRKEFSMKYKDWLDVWFANYGNQFFDISKCIRSRNNDTDTAKPLVQTALKREKIMQWKQLIYLLKTDILLL